MLVKPSVVRALYRAVKMGDSDSLYDALTMKLYYPSCPAPGRGGVGRSGTGGADGGGGISRAGVLAADGGRAPFPVVVFLPGAGVPQEGYAWLAQEIAAAGFAVATYQWLSLEAGKAGIPGPGARPKQLRRKRFGRKPSCPALKGIFAELKRVNRRGVLAGCLDLEQVIFGGHSTGGALALLNANRDFFPAVKGAFAYAAHTAGEEKLGWEAGSFMPLARDLPLLLMGGTEDRVLAGPAQGGFKAARGDFAAALRGTFKEAVRGKRGDRHLLLVEGGNHYGLAWPWDATVGQRFLDGESKGGDKKLRAYLARVIVNFCDYVITGNALSAAELRSLCSGEHPLAAHYECK